MSTYSYPPPQAPPQQQKQKRNRLACGAWVSGCLGTVASVVAILSFLGFSPVGNADGDDDSSSSDRPAAEQDISGSGSSGSSAPVNNSGSGSSVDIDDSGPIMFNINNVAEYPLLYEEVVVYIDGQLAGYMTVDSFSQPTDTLRIAVDGPGRYAYQIEAVTTIDYFGVPSIISGYGEGSITVDAGDSFSLVGDFNTTPFTISLARD
ncbi:MAG: hypothetical protein GYB65_17190 [Chloroflexi bacterium]|nr:hypothetical protein [Chloroflexota bacterium]